MTNITIRGLPGSGKGDVSIILAEELYYERIGMGDVRRKYAKDNGMSLKELNIKAETDSTSDKLVDDKLKELGKTRNDLVVDARLGFYFIPNSFKVFLNADELVRAERVFKAGRETQKYKTIEEAVKGIRETIESDVKRYQKLYGIDAYDIETYKPDLIVNTTKITQEEVADIILEKFKQI